jgi:hypothetical protein
MRNGRAIFAEARLPTWLNSASVAKKPICSSNAAQKIRPRSRARLAVVPKLPAFYGIPGPCQGTFKLSVSSLYRKDSVLGDVRRFLVIDLVLHNGDERFVGHGGVAAKLVRCRQPVGDCKATEQHALRPSCFATRR